MSRLPLSPQRRGTIATPLLRRRAYGMALLILQGLAACSSGEKVPPPPPAEVGAVKAAAAPAPRADAPLVIAFGDSLYAGYQLGPNEGLAPQLERALNAAGTPVRVQNAGVSGDTSAAGRGRLAFVLDNAKQKPALVVLGLGGNDMLRGISPAETRANLTAMLGELKRRDIPVVLTGMRAAPNMGPDYARDFEPIYPDLAKAYGVALYPFLLDGVITEQGLMQGDGMHPTAKGVEKLTAGLAPVVVKALAAK